MIGIFYDTNTKQGKDILVDFMNNHENIRDKSAPFIVASDLCNSAVSMHI
jgi:hypothetical protein